MARKVIYQIVDDLDGAELPAGEGETVQFSLDGRAHEIDLSDANAEALRAALSPYVAAGRKTGAASKSVKTTKSAKPDVDVRAVRAWAIEQGHNVSSRGRVHGHIVEAYQAAHA